MTMKHDLYSGCLMGLWLTHLLTQCMNIKQNRYESRT